MALSKPYKGPRNLRDEVERAVSANGKKLPDLSDEQKRSVREDMARFQPRNDWVLLEVIERTETAGGIALPQSAREGMPKARVLGVGPGVYDNGVLIPTRLERGQIVFTMIQGGYPEINVGDKKYVVCREAQIIGQVETSDAAVA